MRITNHDLLAAESLRTLSGPGAALLRRTEADYDEALDYAIEIQRDALHHIEELERGWALEAGDDLRWAAPDGDMARSQLAFLLAERGDLGDALGVARAVDAAPGFERLLAAVYRGDAAPEAPTLTFLRSGLRGYAADRVRIRLERASGETAAAEAREAALRLEGHARLRGGLALYTVNLGLIASGLVVIALATLRGRLLGDSPARPLPWSPVDGIGVLIRGDFWNRLYFVLLGELASRLGRGGVVDAWMTPELELVLFRGGTTIASLPLLWLTWRHLLAPHAVSAGVFGRGSRALLPVALAATALDLLGTHALGWGAWRLGFHGHWAEGFDESLAWGSPPVALLTTLDYTVWTPIVEELAFRGLLYTSLRRLAGVVPSALAGATLFALLHFYSLPGFLMTFWSGIVWSLAYERASSLWPGIAAHALYNALFVAGLIVAYR